MLVTVVMSMVDLYPGMPTLPTLPRLKVPLRDLTYAALGLIVVQASAEVLTVWDGREASR
ncbi:MAG: hypothetical protein FJ387_22345 [Verrucomicrobia bacterium]|nr:hypothetical protein [Verrucomicrobiota bacterium]